MMREPFLQTPICSLLQCRYPILQAGMGGVARAELVSAVSKTGGYGFLGMVRESPELIAQQIDLVRRNTNQPFGVNLIPLATRPDLFKAELDVCLAKRVHAMCFFWGVDAAAVAQAKAAGCIVLYQVGSVADAIAAEAAGADIIIAQGFEAGGHVHGTVSSLVLVPQIASRVRIPVVASGGFASGESLVAALALGAQGIHCGTAFLATRESFAHDVHKSAIAAAGSDDTVYTDVFAINWPAGSPVRVLRNALTDELGPELLGHDPDEMPWDEIASEDGRPIYRFSTDSPLRNMTGALDELALFAGQVSGLIDDIPSAGERLSGIVSTAERALRRLQQAAVPAAA
ncbi:nitronate monooxygenase [Ferrovibrio sp.]|uniref:NAD(P)H-dependent flavin oxidoreductase n=1 Tax=Ferrovibrio sp. TaxID=1917215 RepID=UPI0025B80653|nr:nitronate monooxygenase [Ferrovibrio sp.]